MFKLINSRNLIRLNLNLRCFSTASNGLERITLPKNLEELGFDHLNRKYRQKKDKLYRNDIFIHGNKRIPIITSKSKPKLNHYYNQRYRKRSNIMLASDGWKKGRFN